LKTAHYQPLGKFPRWRVWLGLVTPLPQIDPFVTGPVLQTFFYYDTASHLDRFSHLADAAATLARADLAFTGIKLALILPPVASPAFGIRLAFWGTSASAKRALSLLII
jgi:hypothetical protein